MRVNGKDGVPGAGQSVEAFLEAGGYNKSAVVVEVNGTILTRTRFAATILAETDRVEILFFVGGGR